jgi:molybdenum cofactor cytidylyltransferase
MADPTLFAIVLAAGESRRFGSTKQLAVHDGRALVAHAMSRAESICGRNSLLVTGNAWREVAAACEPLQGFLVVNTEYRDGLAAAVLLLLADQPLVTDLHLQMLVEKWRRSPDSIVASTYAESFGPPVIFPADLFVELVSLDGDRGAKPVIDANIERTIFVECAEAAFDVDRPEDLREL